MPTNHFASPKCSSYAKLNSQKIPMTMRIFSSMSTVWSHLIMMIKVHGQSYLTNQIFHVTWSRMNSSISTNLTKSTKKSNSSKINSFKCISKKTHNFCSFHHHPGRMYALCKVVKIDISSQFVPMTHLSRADSWWSRGPSKGPMRMLF